MLIVLRGEGVIFLEIKAIEFVDVVSFKYLLELSLLSHFILRVHFLVCLEVIKVFLLFLSESSEEVRVSGLPSFLGSGLHSLFSAIVVLDVQKLSGMEPVELGSVSL